MDVRRAFGVLVGVALSALAVGCGSSKAPGVSGPLATELSYLPRGDVFVSDVATDPRGPAVKSVNALLSSVPAAQLGIAALKSLLASRGIDYQTDIEPMFGNPIVLAFTHLTASTTGSKFLMVWIPHSSLGLNALLKGLASNAPATKSNGATLYQAGGSTIAVAGQTLLFGSSRALVQQALARHASGTGMTASAFSTAMGSVPSNAVVQAQGSLAGVIHGSARQIPWVAAIRGYSFALNAGSSGLSLKFRVDTPGSSLSSAQLPLASGTGTPEFAGNLPIVVGVRDPAQAVNFILAAGSSTSASGYAAFARRQAAAKRNTGYNLTTFASLLTGNLIVESDGHNFLARADVSDPASAARQLAALARVPDDIFPGVRRVARQPGGFLALYRSHGKPLELGAVGSQVVAGFGATAAQLRAFAAAPTTPAPNASGPIAFRVPLSGFLRVAGAGKPPAIIGSALSTLGDITGSAQVSTSALTGTVALSVK